MENFAKAKNVLLVSALTGVLSLGGYVWSNHVSAEAAQDARQNEELKWQRDMIIRFDAYIQNQQELNEWFTADRQRPNRGGN
jgi:hypothetical protein